jgi:dolichyl-phosphate-mannose-protein mannosyltransferase
LFLLMIVTRIPLLRVDRPIDDEVVYSVVAQTIVDGGVPYVDAVERKPPLLFYVYAGVLRAFGHDNWRALHGVELVWIFGTMAGLYAIGRRLFNDETGLTAALLYCVYQAWSYWNNLAFNGEVLMNLPIVWAYAAALSSSRGSRQTARLFLAGGLIGFGFLLKQPAAIALLPLLLLPLNRGAWSGRRPLQRSIVLLASILLGFGFVLMAATAWLWDRGLLAEAYYWTVTDHAIPVMFWITGVENTLAFVAFCLPVTIGAWFSAIDNALWMERRGERTVIVGWVMVSLLGAASSGRFYPHYYIAAIPPCAILAAPWLSRTWSARDPTRLVGRASQVWIAATVVIFALAHSRGLTRQPAVSEAGDYLTRHSSTDARIFVWGQRTRIYLDAHRRPASRFIATFPLTGLIFGAPRPLPGETPLDTRSRIVPGSWDKLIKDFSAHQPDYIVDTEAAADALYPVRQFPALEELLDAEYEPVAKTADGVIYKYDPLKREALAAPVATE